MAWTSSRAIAPRIGVHVHQGKCEVLRERHGAEERARLKQHAEGWNALVAVRLAHAVDVDSPGSGLFKANQISQQ